MGGAKWEAMIGIVEKVAIVVHQMVERSKHDIMVVVMMGEWWS